MAASTPKLEITLTSPTIATIAVAGKVLGTIKIQLKEIETIKGTENPIVVVGECTNHQNGAQTGFVFQELKNLITAQEETITTTTGA